MPLFYVVVGPLQWPLPCCNTARCADDATTALTTHAIHRRHRVLRRCRPMRAGWRACALLLLVTCPLLSVQLGVLAAAAETGTAAEAPAGLAEELAALPTEHCQSTWQLRDIAQAAAWTAQVHGVQRSVLAITTCDLHCMRKLFVPWMHSIQNSRDGDFSQHVVIISNGLSAFAYCDSLRARYRHYCVLDRMCLPPSAPDLQHESRANGMRFGRPLYMFALMQKVTWAMEVLKLGLSVLWMDMDIYFHASPFNFFTSLLSDADFIIQTELWDHTHSFRGDACRFQWRLGQSCDSHTYNPYTPSLTPDCCGMVVNGGMWLAHPTQHGIALMQTWVAVMFEDGIVSGRAWNGTAYLDQYWLSKVITEPIRSAGLYRWDGHARRYERYTNVTRDPAQTVVYRTSGQRTQSICSSACGWRGNNKGFPYRTLCRGAYDDSGALCSGASPDTPAPGAQLVCSMPRHAAERMVSVHMNCNSDVGFKRLAMMSWMNVTLDEQGYKAMVRTDPDTTVSPDW